ncbi:MAG: hypothetical protein CSA09_05435 [Candidatus Contendobacter odensis]|uniref:Transposase n=1 Tax=Candidatus Contendibacter odensensis TaxID=1400860 RepID=A0A2G6PDW0_9GAMM|nr:MAG: hypothetical protein CSA09_05435 [Candidatus Contendobacter odensis]
MDRWRSVNAIFLSAARRCQWWYLPRQCPNWKTVYSCSDYP